jgi:hypothetical protein
VGLVGGKHFDDREELAAGSEHAYRSTVRTRGDVVVVAMTP